MVLLLQVIAITAATQSLSLQSEHLANLKMDLVVLTKDQEYWNMLNRLFFQLHFTF